MKKFLTLIGMITCIFGLTACSQETLSDYDQQKLSYAESTMATEVVQILKSFAEDEASAAVIDEYTAEEVEYVFEQSYGILADGYAVKRGVTSYTLAKATIGDITGIGEASARINDDQIIVTVQVQGSKKNAEAEVILSNDMFLKLESAALNPVYSLGEKAGRAGMNTIIGMGTVFAVLILISFIISLLKYIPALQAKFAKKEKEEINAEGIDNAATHITEQEVIADTPDYNDYTDESELVAVIAAAIAASEGAAVTEGFVVRSIRKINRSRY